MLERTRDRLREMAKEEAEKQAETAKHEVGEIVIDATDQYFPDEVKARRRRDIARGFLVGVGTGVALHYALSR